MIRQNMKYCFHLHPISISKMSVFCRGVWSSQLGVRLCWLCIRIWLLLWVFLNQYKRHWIQFKACGLPMLPYLKMLPYTWLFVCPHRGLFVQLSRTETNWGCQLLSLKPQSVVTVKTGMLTMYLCTINRVLVAWKLRLKSFQFMFYLILRETVFVLYLFFEWIKLGLQFWQF